MQQLKLTNVKELICMCHIGRDTQTDIVGRSRHEPTWAGIGGRQGDLTAVKEIKWRAKGYTVTCLFLPLRNNIFPSLLFLHYCLLATSEAWTTGAGGSPRPSQLQIQPTHQRRRDQGNGERRHSVQHTHSEWTTEQVDTFPYLGSLISEDGECTTEVRTRLNRGQAIGHHYRKYGKVTAYRFQRRYD